MLNNWNWLQNKDTESWKWKLWWDRNGYQQIKGYHMDQMTKMTPKMIRMKYRKVRKRYKNDFRVAQGEFKNQNETKFPKWHIKRIWRNKSDSEYLHDTKLEMISNIYLSVLSTVNSGPSKHQWAGTSSFIRCLLWLHLFSHKNNQ